MALCPWIGNDIECDFSLTGKKIFEKFDYCMKECLEKKKLMLSKKET